MEVPQTPLHTSRVLKEEKDAWEDVKVGYITEAYLFRNNSSILRPLPKNYSVEILNSCYRYCRRR